MILLNKNIYKKIIEYLIIIIFTLISTLYLYKILINTYRVVNVLYLIPLLLVLFFVLKYSNIKKKLLFISNYLQKLNNILYKNTSRFTIILTTLFIASSFFLRKYDITTVFFDQKNYFIIYFFLKLIFFFGIFTSIINSGYIFSIFFFHKNENHFQNKVIIICFGIIILSILGIILGLSKLLYFNLNLIIFSLLILFSGQSVNFFLKYKNIYYKKIFFFIDNFYLSILILSIILLFIRSLLPFMDDGDVWGHYLNYYHSIIEKHEIYNISYPAHFAQSKGFGLNFLTLLISDVFSGQLISFIFMCSIFLMFYDFGSRILKNNFVIGLTAILIASYPLILDGTIFPVSLNKLHISFNFFYTLIFWSAYNLAQSNYSNKKFLFLFIVACFFCGFAHSFFSFIIFLTLLFFFLIIFFQFSKNYKFLFIGVLFLCLGVTTSLLLNYIKLGILDFAFVDIFSKYADEKKLSSIVGQKYILLPLINSDQISRSFDFVTIVRLFDLITFHYVPSLFRSGYTLLLYFFIVIFFIIKKKKFFLNFILLIIFSLSISYLILLLYNAPSLKRGFFFVNILFAIFFSFNLLSFIKYSSFKIKFFFEILLVAPVLFFFLFSIHSNFHANKNYYYSLLFKGSSFKEALLTCNLNQVQIDIDCKTLNFLTNSNSKYTFEKLYSITQSGGWAATLPRPGLINEPYFNLSLKLNKLEKNSNNEIANEFFKNNIHYFFIDLSRPIYQNQNGQSFNYNFFRNNLKVIDSKDNKYLLKLDNNFSDKNNDEYFLNFLNLKISYLINYIFSEEFYEKNIYKKRNDVHNEFKIMSKCVNNFNQVIINNIVNSAFDNNGSSKKIIDTIRYELLKNIDQNYDLKQMYLYEQNLTSSLKWKHSALGELTREIDNIEKFYIHFNMPKECTLYILNPQLEPFIKTTN